MSTRIIPLLGFPPLLQGVRTDVTEIAISLFSKHGFLKVAPFISIRSSASAQLVHVKHSEAVNRIIKWRTLRHAYKAVDQSKAHSKRFLAKAVCFISEATHLEGYAFAGCMRRKRLQRPMVT